MKDLIATKIIEIIQNPNVSVRFGGKDGKINFNSLKFTAPKKKGLMMEITADLKRSSETVDVIMSHGSNEFPVYLTEAYTREIYKHFMTRQSAEYQDYEAKQYERINEGF